MTYLLSKSLPIKHLMPHFLLQVFVNPHSSFYSTSAIVTCIRLTNNEFKTKILLLIDIPSRRCRGTATYGPLARNLW